MNSHLIKNILLKFFDVEKAISSKDIFLICAIFSATNFTFDGKFFFHLKGTGERYGESVSTSSLSKGTISTDLHISSTLLNVIIPLNDI